MVKVSIITPVKADTEEKVEWFNEMVESVYNQSYENFELIVVNDGVKDFELKEKYDRTRVINLDENVGTAIARNTAAYHATGELLLPVDADDILTPNSIESLYNKYEKGKFVYGNLQLIVPSGNGWEIGRVTKFPEFNCDNALNLSGSIPVTALHSKKDWENSGGWKPILTDGLEDVEYWISLIRNCVLGIRIENVILQYRKFRQSRSEQMKLTDKLGRMRHIINQIHKDIYQGGIMACPGGCGNKKRTPQQMGNNRSVGVLESMKLESYPDSELVQLKYNGPMRGKFGIVGAHTGIPYAIKGHGHELLVHNSDMQRFRGVGRTGALFVEVNPKTMFIHKQKMPQNSVDVPDTFNPGIPEIANIPTHKKELSIEMLEQNDRITVGLKKLDVTIEKIATDMVVGDLRALGIPGIGPVTELKILEKAKELYFG